MTIIPNFLYNTYVYHKFNIIDLVHQLFAKGYKGFNTQINPKILSNFRKYRNVRYLQIKDLLLQC